LETAELVEPADDEPNGDALETAEPADDEPNDSAETTDTDSAEA